MAVSLPLHFLVLLSFNLPVLLSTIDSTRDAFTELLLYCLFSQTHQRYTANTATTAQKIQRPVHRKHTSDTRANKE